MNLNEYEVINRPIDRSKTWIDVKHHRIYSREMRGNYYNVLKKLNPITNSYDYFIVLYKIRPTDTSINLRGCGCDSFGRLVINLSNKDWNELEFNSYKDNVQISVSVVDYDNNGTLYRFDN